MLPVRKAFLYTALAAPLILGGLAASGPVAHAKTATTCTAALGGGCGPYTDPNIPMSTGYDTYASNQDVGSVTGTSATLTATSAGTWSENATVKNSGGSVQIYANTQQLTNDWDPTTQTWTGDSDMPLSSFSAVNVNYNETMDRGSATSAEFAPDVWNDSYGDDVMFWADTQGRCNSGSYGDQIGTAVIDGQTWTVNRYGNSPGDEIIFVLDSNPSVPDSCAQQTSGTINILAGFQWLVANGYMSSIGSLSQLNSGFEITSSAAGSTFSMNSYSITATVGSNSGGGNPPPVQQAPAATTSAASQVTSSGATMNGSVNPEGADTSYQFDYGTTASYGSSTTSADAGSGTAAESESAPLTGLQPGTTYHYRLEATNSAGTTDGADQTFTTPAVSNGGQVTVDSQSGAHIANANSLSWTQTVGTGANRVLLAEASVGIGPPDTNCGQALTDNGVAMTKLATVHSDNSNAGWMNVYGLVNPPSGANALQMTVSSGCTAGTPNELTAGGIAFDGVDQSNPWGAVTTAYGNGAHPHATISSTAGDMIAAFSALGSNYSSPSVAKPAVSQFTENQGLADGAGNSAGATSAATGSPVTVQFNGTADWWAFGALEVNAEGARWTIRPTARSADASIAASTMTATSGQ